MDWLAAALLGALQGLTEFLPVSSTAHLLLGERALGFQDEASVFTVTIQFGSILAIMWLYREKIISVVKGLPHDPENDFVPITGLISISQALVTNPSVPASDLKELIELARSRPGGLNYGTFGVGSTGHLNMEMLQSRAGVKLVPVHYKGATPALTDVIAGHIQMMLISTSSAVPFRLVAT